MKQISGHVLVKETNLGIPDLIVAAYDSGRPIRESLRRGPDGKGLSLQDAGRRIGSVLTEPDGRFVLTSEDLEFQGNEQRPNLLIIVFAPEDVQGLDMPYPLPPEERILYISAVPRNDAGAEEAFTIRLLQAQLDHFDLKAGASSPDSSVDDHRLAAAIEGSWNLSRTHHPEQVLTDPVRRQPSACRRPPLASKSGVNERRWWDFFPKAEIVDLCQLGSVGRSGREGLRPDRDRLWEAPPAVEYHVM